MSPHEKHLIVSVRSSQSPPLLCVTIEIDILGHSFDVVRHGNLFGTFLLDNENAGRSAICVHMDLLPEEVLVTHLITCHGPRDLVNIQSERHSFVIINVHIEPDLTPRQLRDRLHLIHQHWPAYPNGVGVILGDFNICDPDNGRFNVWHQTFTDGDPKNTAVFHSFFPHVLEVAESDYTRRDFTALGVHTHSFKD